MLVLLAGVGAGLVLFASNRARPVTLRQAESRLAKGVTGTPLAGRPAPGVYRYKGSGTESLSLPPLSQAEGPSIPGTVTLRGASCWVFRVDYSTHHWETWRYCLHDKDVWEAGGQTWQLWSVGPLNITNLSTFTCAPGSMSLPSTAVVDEVWTSRCTGTNTAVKGQTISSGPYRFVGLTSVSVGSSPVRAAHFLRMRTDSGAQRGTERSDVWLSTSTGLPLRLQQNITIRASTFLGPSTYSQSGVFALASLVPNH